MFGILLATLGTLTGEVGQTLAKQAAVAKQQTIYGIGFVNTVMATIMLVLLFYLVPADTLIGEYTSDFRFSMSAVPLGLFVARVILELIASQLFITALELTTRATYSFLRMLTIPFLVMADLALGFDVTPLAILGIGIILVTTMALLSTRTLRREGMWYVIVGSLIGVFSVSIYQYNITYHNSVMAEQIILGTIYLIYFYGLAHWKTGRSPLRHFRSMRVIAQSFGFGTEIVLTGFAYLFAPSSIIMTARRTSAVFWAILSGNRIFREQHLAAKFAGLGILSSGLLLLAFVS